jgi:glycosyltransferase involved in cell wall biosynthesis
MCTLNGQRYLTAQLDSIASQTQVPAEMVVRDDGSTDATIDIVHEFASRAPFPVRVHRNTDRLGIPGNFAAAIADASGDLIALADQDDVWYPQKLQRLADAIAADPGALGAFSDADCIDAGGARTGQRLWDGAGFTRRKRRRFAGRGGLSVLVQHNVVTGATLAFRSHCRAMLLPIPSCAVHDQWIALLLEGTGHLVPVPEPLIGYRIHPANTIGLGGTPIRRQLVRGYDKSALRAGEAEIAHRAAERLSGRAGTDVVATLRAKAEHSTFRGTLPRRVPERFRAVLGRALRGRYRRYSNGLKSWGYDLLHG